MNSAANISWLMWKRMSLASAHMPKSCVGALTGRGKMMSLYASTWSALSYAS